MERKPVGAIAEEIKQGNPFRSVSMEAVLTLLRTADVIHRHFEGVVLPHGVTMQQYNVLRILRGAGDRGLPTLEVAKRMVEKAPGVTRLIDRMAAKGWVDRVRCTEDRRIVYCRITDTGLGLVTLLDEPMAAADDAALSRLSERDQRQLIRLLDAIRAGHRELINAV
jgi:DNA-binding MarR family transcriptional regulator